mmetsp:Transcript_2918/g.10329  ORF Transcript_2918/g.10329 Transcript_2918/m.10329 type:complete len:202 (-) Transcript_2918:226-831(-)
MPSALPTSKPSLRWRSLNPPAGSSPANCGSGSRSANSMYAPGTSASLPHANANGSASAFVDDCRRRPSGLTFSTPPASLRLRPAARSRALQSSSVETPSPSVCTATAAWFTRGPCTETHAAYSLSPASSSYSSRVGAAHGRWPAAGPERSRATTSCAPCESSPTRSSEEKTRGSSSRSSSGGEYQYAVRCFLGKSSRSRRS